MPTILFMFSFFDGASAEAAPTIVPIYCRGFIVNVGAEMGPH